MKPFTRVFSYLAIPVFLCVAPIALFASCKSSHQQIQYNTIYSVEKSATAAYDSYIDSVIAGKVSTNDLPKVSKAFNKFQAATLVALDTVQFQTNAVAPASLIIEANDLINLITTLTRK